ncbi:MAG TPA: glycosyltransferase family 87 protein [Terriglobales bacterium]|nr:glycosyltransferase family 87 protein [Terriglobales bacterium]
MKQLRRLVGPLPGAREAAAISYASLAVGALACAVSLYYGFQGQLLMGRPMGGDFIGFYVAGKVLNEFDPARIYDIQLTTQLQHQTLPEMPAMQMLPYANPPCVALLFRPLARLPYRWAYCVWLALSMGLYVSGLRLLLGGFRGARARTAFLLALSSAPFLFETWIGGQLSVIAFLAISVFVYFLRRQQFFLAGLALGLAAYKPPLIVIPAVMVVFGACWRSLAGLCASTALMSLLSVATVGINGCFRWAHTLRVFGQLATGENSVLRRVKYVDLTSFFHMLLGTSPAAQAGAWAASGALFLLLARVWWQSRKWETGRRNLLWAATLCWALIVNVYAPIYDTIILAPALVLAACSIESPDDHEIFTAWLALLYLLPWVTQLFAEFLRTQLLTLALGCFGYWVLTLARRKDSGAVSAHAQGDLAVTVVS